MHHTVAYHSSFTSVAETEIAAVSDQAMMITNNHIVPQQDVKLLYAAAAGATLVRSRLDSPKMHTISSSDIVNISAAASFGSPQHFDDYYRNPFTFRRLEEIQAFATHTAVGAEDNSAILGFSIADMPVPPGDIWTIRGLATGTLVAFTWSDVGSITWQQTLPQGQYAVIGAEFQSAGALAGRFTFEGNPFRPGAPAITAEGNLVDNRFLWGGLGVWGTFHNTFMPNVAILSASADTSEHIKMQVVKIG